MKKIFKFGEILPQVPNLLFRNRFKFNFELLPFESVNITWKKKWNFIVAGLNQFFLPSRPLGYPVIAQVEPANVCNLKCPLCFTTSMSDSRPSAMLPFDTFKHFIDDISDYLLLMVLWNWGEPFLNPDIFKMIEYATSKNILVHSSTNGNIVFDDETADKMVKSRLTNLIIAVDGATQETYSKYREGGNLERVKENIRTIVRAKKRNSSSLPRLTLRFVAMKHNETELPLVEQLAHELEVDFFAVKSVDMPENLEKNLDQKYRPENEKFHRYDYVTGTYIREQKPFVCMRPWKRIALDALGELISCEYDYKNLHSFGNIGNGKPVLDVWKSSISRTFRKLFNKGHNEFYHCKGCTYKNIRMDDCNLYAYPIRPTQNQE